MRLSYRVGLSILAVIAIVGGTFAFKALGKSVNVVVDGKSQTVSTYSSNVKDVLADADVDVDKRDDVTPSLKSGVKDGAAINVTRARPVSYTIDGIQEQQYVTALTVDDALQELGVADNAEVSADRDQQIPLKGTTLEITTSKDITINVDGQQLTASSTAPDVATLLAEQGVVLEQQDYTDPLATSPLTPGMVITVNRVRITQVQEVQTIDYQVVEQPDGGLEKGEKKTQTEGVEGEQIVTYNVTTTNGVETAKEQAAVQVTKEPVNKVVLVGTAEPAPSSPSNSGGSGSGSSGSSGSSGGGSGSSGSGSGSSGGADTSSADGLNWGALAQCESGGNPKAVNPSGKYYGLYQFSIATWQSVGGSGLPTDASPDEQTMRAKILYQKAGAGQWPVCGKNLFT